jgi:hypothetical protein
MRMTALNHWYKFMKSHDPPPRRCGTATKRWARVVVFEFAGCSEMVARE